MRKLADTPSQHANFFYKNIVWVMAMFWYQFFCNFDGGYLFDYVSKARYAC